MLVLEVTMKRHQLSLSVWCFFFFFCYHYPSTRDRYLQDLQHVHYLTILERSRITFNPRHLNVAASLFWYSCLCACVSVCMRLCEQKAQKFLTD